MLGKSTFFFKLVKLKNELMSTFYTFNSIRLQNLIYRKKNRIKFDNIIDRFIIICRMNSSTPPYIFFYTLLYMILFYVSFTPLVLNRTPQSEFPCTRLWNFRLLVSAKNDLIRVIRGGHERDESLVEEMFDMF